LQIPVGGLGTAVAEERREHRQPGRHVDTVVVPADQDVDRQGMAVMRNSS
jgi:hypothetical protein